MAFNGYNSPVRVPCKDCIDRSPECHATCSKYLDYKSKLDAFNKKARENTIPRGGDPFKRLSVVEHANHRGDR